MHSGHIGLEQMKHLVIMSWPGCLRQSCGSSTAVGAAVRGSAGLVCCAAVRKRRPGRGSIVEDENKEEADEEAEDDSSCRINLLTSSDESSPHWEQTNCTGLCNISGETSKAYLAPHEHWIFMVSDSTKPHLASI